MMNFKKINMMLLLLSAAPMLAGWTDMWETFRRQQRQELKAKEGAFLALFQQNNDGRYTCAHFVTKDGTVLNVVMTVSDVSVLATCTVSNSSRAIECGASDVLSMARCLDTLS